MPKTKRKAKSVPKGKPLPKIKQWLTQPSRPTKPARQQSGAALEFAPVTESQAALDRAQVRELRKTFRETIATFRPRKSDRDSIVFLSRPTPFEVTQLKEAGKRVPKFFRVDRSSRRRTYAVYVGKRGGVRPTPQVQRDWDRIEKDRLLRERRKELGRKYRLTESDRELIWRRARHRQLLAEQTPAYVRPRYHDPMATPYRRVAKEQFAAQTKAVRQKRVTDPKTGKKTNVPVGSSLLAKSAAGLDWNRQVVPTVIKELNRAFDALPNVEKDLTVRLTAVVQTPDGERTVQADAKFEGRFNQIFTPQGLENYARLATYAAFAEELSMLGLVTQGSARNVSRRSYNEGLDRDEWVKNEQGERWEKNEHTQVTISAMNVTVYQVE